MKIGVIADTHDAGDVLEQAVKRFITEDVAAVVHCGDIVAPFSATPFDADFDFYAVRGNNDGEWALADTVEEFGTYLGEMGELTLDGEDFGVYHGTSDAIVDALVESGTYDYVLHGHTHERVREERDGTVRLNPGGVPIPQAPNPQAAVVIDTETGQIATFELD